MMYYRIFAIAGLLAIAILLISCASSNIVEHDPVDIMPETSEIAQESSDIHDRADDIKDTAQDGAIKAPSLPHWESIINNADGIIGSTVRINELTAKLYDKQANIDSLHESLQKANSNITKLQGEIDRIRAREKSLADKLWHFMGFAAAIGVISSLLLLFFRAYAIAIPLIGASLTLLILTLFLNAASERLEAWVGHILISIGIIILLSFGAIAYYIVVNRRAVYELFLANEVAKEQMDDKTRDRIYGDDSNCIMNKYQGDRTKKIIHEFKKHITNGQKQE